jgi:hypothetical protein
MCGRISMPENSFEILIIAGIVPSTGVGRPRGRIHGITRMRPAVPFSAEEAPALAPVPEAVLGIPAWTDPGRAAVTGAELDDQRWPHRRQNLLIIRHVADPFRTCPQATKSPSTPRCPNTTVTLGRLGVSRRVDRIQPRDAQVVSLLGLTFSSLSRYAGSVEAKQRGQAVGFLAERTRVGHFEFLPQRPQSIFVHDGCGVLIDDVVVAIG